ncbi:hypothetical protein HPB49_008537 [Dermacentor silvarum]|uniref:Uncharacterized protein n=1 Tax=Dermacentor silvarum TaxID=543639 RepID=A0ACB8DNI7_DERSI|nr:hypothetical protein HPB49_008537 [Dermacentor silvarum]
MADSKFYLAEDTLMDPEVATCGDAVTPTEIKSDAGQTMKPCLSPHHVDSSKRGPTPYLLSGFGCSSLYERPILFANSLPSGRVCAGCRVVVPARALLLPCGHILCELCRDMCFLNTRGLARYQDASDDGPPRSAMCPQDGASFVEADLQVLTFRLKHMYRELVFCVHAEFGCPYKAQLRHLEEHFSFDCRYHPKTCSLCGKSDIPACDIRNHVSYCAGRRTRLEYVLRGICQPASSVLHHSPRLARKHSQREVHERSIKKTGNCKRLPPDSSFHQGSRLKIQRLISGNQPRATSVFRSCRWRYPGQRVTTTLALGTTKPAYGGGLGFVTPSLPVWTKSAVLHGNSSARARTLRRAPRKIDIAWATLPRCPQRPVTAQLRFSIEVNAPSPLKRGTYEKPQEATDSTLSSDAKAKVLDAAAHVSEKTCSVERNAESAGRVTVFPSEGIKRRGGGQQQVRPTLQTVPERLDVVGRQGHGLISASGHDQKVDAVRLLQRVECPCASTTGLDGASRIFIAAAARLTSHFQRHGPRLSLFPALTSTGSSDVVLWCGSEYRVPSQPVSVQEGETCVPQTPWYAAGSGLLGGCRCSWPLLPEESSVGSHASDQLLVFETVSDPGCERVLRRAADSTSNGRSLDEASQRQAAPEVYALQYKASTCVDAGTRWAGCWQ